MPGERMKSRLVFLDLMRGWAVLVMIEVHVFNAFILPDLKSTGWFSVLNYINGLVAPSFIFISGFVFILSSQKKLAAFREYGNAFWKQLGRLGLILSAGYFLHLPVFSFRSMITQTDEAGWHKFYQSDVLHCIALGLLLLFLLRVWIRSDRFYQNLLLGGGIGIVALAPFLGDIDFHRSLHPSVAAYMNGLHYSIFPVFPWMAFMFAGGYAAALFSEARSRNHAARYFSMLSIAGFLFTLGGGLLRWLSLRIPFASQHIRYDPWFFMERLGIVLLLLWLCWWYAERRKTEQSFVLDVSRESLQAYTAHLLIIYGRFWNGHSLSFYYGKQLSILECCAATLGLMLVIILAAKLWGHLKQSHPARTRIAFMVTTTAVALLFFIR